MHTCTAVGRVVRKSVSEELTLKVRQEGHEAGRAKKPGEGYPRLEDSRAQALGDGGGGLWHSLGEDGRPV